jgi:subtilisin family serine protease
MADVYRYRHYVVTKWTKTLWDAYAKVGDADSEASVRAELAKYLPSAFADDFRVVARPSLKVGRLGAESPGFHGDDHPSEVVIGLAFADPGSAASFQEAVRSHGGEFFVGSGADLPLYGGDHWCPRDAADPMFADRAAAERLVRVPFLKSKQLTGAGVNVVVVDQGLDKVALGTSYGSGWPVNSASPGKTQSPEPGTVVRTHGMMVANNILQVAPDTTLFDLPMVPPRIIDIEDYFLCTADAAFRMMLDDIETSQAGQEDPTPWILVNAWAIFDRSQEYPPGSYTNDPYHPFNMMVAEAAESGFDVVFCAGNCGQFCPDQRCGALDKGPAQSIFGANCHPEVLSVGAARADTMWLGYSSQGPGQPGFWPLGYEKPDLCAPSQFCETDDAFETNGGTSAACALAAGVIAALRSESDWRSDNVSTQELKSILNSSARKSGTWNNRLGNGILDAEAAYDELQAQYSQVATV